MEQESQARHALVPDQEKRDLSLPAEMVQRGLELALHIEQKQGIQPLQTLAELDRNTRKDWQQWALTYEGQQVKDQGRCEGISIHPAQGKLFLIVSVSSRGATSAGRAARVALWVEDVQGLELGEKEGSFCLDGTKWIQVGETYAFQGRVFKFGWMDPQLNSTGFRDSVMVKVKQKDLRQV